MQGSIGEDLGEVEVYIFKVEQSPFVRMIEALHPSMRALRKPNILTQIDQDDKFIVVNCTSKIMRITILQVHIRMS